MAMATRTKQILRAPPAWIQCTGYRASSSIAIPRHVCTRRVACQPARSNIIIAANRIRAIISYPNPFHFHQSYYSSGSSNKVDNNFAAINECNRFSIIEENGNGYETGENDTIPQGSDNSTGYFPWRHESQPTRRLLEKNDLSGMPNNFRARLIRRIVSCRELNISLLEAMPVPFFTHGWESELVANFKQAFVFALSELLTSIFQTPVEKNEQGVISIDSDARSIINPTTPSTIAMKNDEYLHRMMDKNLLAIFQSVNADKLRLKLSIRPVEATLEHIFTVPLLSREIVEKKPHLKGGFQKIENAFSHQGASYSEVKGMTFDLANEIGDADAYTRTVIADVTIKCTEFFQVRDALTGAILQGMGDDDDDKEVIHGVRFEVVTEKGENGGRKIGSWKIIDFDDMLDGNVFH